MNATAEPDDARAGRRKPTLWLQRQLTVRLMLPLLVIVLATGALGASAAKRLTDRVFDRWLFDAAESVATLIRFDSQGRAQLALQPQAERLLLYDEVDRTSFMISQQGRMIAGANDIPAPLACGNRERVAYNAMLRGLPVRVARVLLNDGRGHAADVRIAETLAKRERAAQDLELLMLPMAVLVLVAAVAIVLAVRGTVAPLERLASRWNERSHRSLAPIRDDDLPGELAPFALALNGLLARIRAMLDRERRFAATAAHQLRTPLAGLQLGLARAAEQPDIESARAVIRELSGNTQRAARLVQQLLLLGQLDPESRGDFGVQPVDLLALAQEVGSAHANQALERDIELELVTSAQKPVIVQAQPELIAEALGNLIDNALRYTPAAGRVAVEVEDAPPCLSVADSGWGIAADERATVIERFSRGRHARGEGSGLGLSIVRDIAALHGAQLVIGDSAWGGARVTLRFPPPGSSIDGAQSDS